MAVESVPVARALSWSARGGSGAWRGFDPAQRAGRGPRSALRPSPPCRLSSRSATRWHRRCRGRHSTTARARQACSFGAARDPGPRAPVHLEPPTLAEDAGLFPWRLGGV